MAALPSPTQVAGGHTAIYEAYYQQIDPNGSGKIEAIVAAKFLKKSSLSDVILSRVWDLSDPGRKGYLNKNGFFVALKLCSLAQAGRDLNIANITLDSPPPKMGDLPKIPVNKSSAPAPTIPNSMAPTVDWAIMPAEKAKYDLLFDSLQPQNGMIVGNKVRGMLMASKLPMDTLGKIWDLADMDKDGMLDRHEFMVAMHLVYKALGKCPIPNSLPPELMPPAKRKEPAQFASFPTSIPIVTAPAPAPVVPPLPLVQSAIIAPMEAPKPVVPPQPVLPWVVNAGERAKYDELFLQTDVDKDGFVSGLEIKDVFLRSGVPQPVLAHIWGLCDIKQSGKLNGEQFALSMWFINQKLLGNELPAALTPEMIPPSFRAAKPPADGTAENSVAPYSNPELDMITKDIEELAREKHILETDIAQKEADINIKHGEIKSLQSELDTLAATLKQLENQKGEAQKRLNDLKAQKSSLDKELSDVQLEIDEEENKVDNLRRQAEEQESSLKVQEEELSTKKQELESLKQEEAGLEQKQKDSRNQLDGLTKNLQDTQLQISQAKAKITQLQEQTRQMTDAIASCDSAISTGDASVVVDTCLSISPEFKDPEYYKIAALVNGGSPVVQTSPTMNADPFSNKNGPASGFGSEDLFQNDPFKSTKPGADPFTSPFNASFPAQSIDGFSADPFSSFGGLPKNDPFDPFGDGKPQARAKSPVDDSGKDPFGCDPFAILHAPTAASGPPGRPESPSPALPPKKSKQPPPRPAPPRPAQQPAMRAAPLPPAPSPEPSRGADPFVNGAGGFADFADFDTKCLHKSGTPKPARPCPFIPNPRHKPCPEPPMTWRPGISMDPCSCNTPFSNTKDEVLDQKIQTVPKIPANHLSPKSAASPSGQHRYADMEFTEDPFRNYRYEDPFAIANPFDDDKNNLAAPSSGEDVDPFGFAKDADFKSDFAKLKVNGGTSGFGEKVSPMPPEEQQFAWAAAESKQLEEERQRRRRQEDADFAYALALSQADKKKTKKGF